MVCPAGSIASGLPRKNSEIPNATTAAAVQITSVRRANKGSLAIS